MEVKLRVVLSFLLSVLVLAACQPGSVIDADTEFVASTGCQTVDHGGDAYTICSYLMGQHDIRLFHSDATGEPYRQFDTLERELDEQGQTLVFAMNGGMYHEDRRPVGFYRDKYGDQASVNTNDGPGNFHLKPNGVFWLTDTQAGITESQTYLDQGLEPAFATQSGPMVLIGGALHEGLNPQGTSHRRRNGVGVSADGQMVHFAISDSAVTFYDFATLFRDVVKVPNALFLDGQVSRIFAPEIDRNELGSDLGPIVGVVN